MTRHHPVETRIAWFSPVPPSTSGIAAYTADVVPALRAAGLHVDVFAEQETPSRDGVEAFDLRDFVWMQRRRPYDLPVYHLGNARCHDSTWGYLFHQPGLVVLHDAQVHQARARALLQRYRPRLDDYEAEFTANHPEAPADIARLVAAGLGGSLYAHWPHIRLLLRTARLAAVHSPALATRLGEAYGVDVEVVPMGVGDPLAPAPATTPAAIRARHGIPEGAVVVGAFGGVTPEKRIPELLRALAASSRDLDLHLLLVGAEAPHYDVRRDAAEAGVAERLHACGFVADDELGAYLAAVDVCACLRWPSNGETSASWWRAMAAGRATIITDLTHQPEVPVVDPRGWRPLGPAAATPVAVAIPILDEHQALVGALETLARSPSTRRTLGDAARAFWHADHQVVHMAEAYLALVARARTRPVPIEPLPPHLSARGDEHLTSLLKPFDLASPPALAP
jgi:glycosyltransferase involved in cell wall biosynthesis